MNTVGILLGPILAAAEGVWVAWVVALALNLNAVWWWNKYRNRTKVTDFDVPGLIRAIGIALFADILGLGLLLSK